LEINPYGTAFISNRNRENLSFSIDGHRKGTSKSKERIWGHKAKSEVKQHKKAILTKHAIPFQQKS
jgi:hypothetical protein